MSSAGHILDAIKRLRQNRSLRVSNREKFKGSNRETIYADKNIEDKAFFPQFPDKEVKESIREIREKANAKKQKELFFIIVFCIPVIPIFIYLLYPKQILGIEIKKTSKSLWENAITWSGEISQPLRIGDTEFLYIPVVRRGLDGKLKPEDIPYTIYSPNMIGSETINIMFFNKDTVQMGTLLTKNGSINMMFLSPPSEGSKLKIIYYVAEEDTNRNGIINYYDEHILYISDLNGRNLTSITKRNIAGLEWVNQDKELLIEFVKTKDPNDSLFGMYNIENSSYKLLNKLHKVE